jgi:hypothetical protein
MYALKIAGQSSLERLAKLIALALYEGIECAGVGMAIQTLAGPFEKGLTIGLLPVQFSKLRLRGP